MLDATSDFLFKKKLNIRWKEKKWLHRCFCCAPKPETNFQYVISNVKKYKKKTIRFFLHYKVNTHTYKIKFGNQTTAHLQISMHCKVTWENTKHARNLCKYLNSSSYKCIKFANSLNHTFLLKTNSISTETKHSHTLKEECCWQ